MMDESPGVPLHFTHRGVNRAATFLDDEDFSAYRQLLGEVLSVRGIALHDYVLMTNHVHLLLTPPCAGSLSAAMCQLGRRYVPAFNRRYGRTGTLWEGRFKSCLVDTDRYVLTVQRYIELNPVRAAMVETPEAYRWSSARGSLGLCADPLLSLHKEGGEKRAAVKFPAEKKGARVKFPLLGSRTSESTRRKIHSGPFLSRGWRAAAPAAPGPRRPAMRRASRRPSAAARSPCCRS